MEDDWTDGDGQEDDGEDEGVQGNGGEVVGRRTRGM